MKLSVLKSVRLAFLPCVLASVFLSACAPNPIIGRWGRSRSSGPITVAETLTIAADGSLSISFAGGAMCTGTITSAGARWTAMSMNNTNTITISGSPMCSGSVSCTIGGVAVPADCMSVQDGIAAEAMTYTLSGNNTSLTLVTSAGDSRVYTRSM